MSQTDAPTRAAGQLVRPLEGRYLGGVALGLARYAGISVGWVRVGLVVATVVLNGLAVIAYGLGWILIPQEDAADGMGDHSRSAAITGRPSLAEARRRWQATSVAQAQRFEHIRLLLAGIGMLIGAAYLYSGTERLHADIRRVIPALVVLVGAGVALSQLDHSERASRLGVRGGFGRGMLRMAAGVLLVAAGILMFFRPHLEVGQVTTVLVAVSALLAGLGLVLAPLGLRLWRALEAERALRVRETERAEITAHLHDSVLQTLALIQRRPDDPVEVTRLARAQERELRAWLYGGESARQEQTISLKEAVRRVVAEVEDAENVAVSPVIVGDAPVCERTMALVQALREATSNAARHGRVGVSVYVECDESGIEAFIRDRGPGVDLAAIPPDRFGVRRSIIDRMARNGGTGEVRSAATGGTEVILRLPLPDPDDGGTT